MTCNSTAPGVLACEKSPGAHTKANSRMETAARVMSLHECSQARGNRAQDSMTGGAQPRKQSLRFANATQPQLENYSIFFGKRLP